MASVLSGRMGELRAGTSFVDAKLVGLITKYSIQIASQIEEVNYMDAFEDENDTTAAPFLGTHDFITGYKWSGSGEGRLARKDLNDAAGYKGQKAILGGINPNGDKVWITAYVSNDTANSILYYYAGLAMISNVSIDNDASSALTFSFDFQGKGPLTIHYEGDP